MTNPLLSPFAFPPFQSFKPEHIVPAITQCLEENLKNIEHLLTVVEAPTWDNLIMPLEAQEDRLSQMWSCVSHLNNVASNPALREAYEACLPKLSDYATQIGQNKKLYEAYVSIQQSAAFAHYSVVQKKVITDALRDFKLSGVALSEEARERFSAITKELTLLQNTFQNHVMDATDHWFLDIVDQSELKGIPEQTIALAKEKAKQAQATGWRLTLDYPCFHAVITFAESATLRQKLHEAYFTRASDLAAWGKEWDNTPLIDAIIRLRHEKAQILGFKHYAECSLATKMAENSEAVMTFLTELAEKVKPAAQAEFAQLKAFVQEEYKVNELHPWDIAFYSEKMRQKKYTLSQEQLRAYFPLDQVLKGLFEVVHRIYGLRIKAHKIEEKWHETVLFYEISDRQNFPLGYFYLDLFSRNQKRGGAWMDEGRVRRRSSGGDIQLPIAFLTCNFRPATQELPSLLTHEEVVTLFHEFGHGLHHLLTKMEYAPVSGIHGVAWDAVELPSQFMENWCWQWEALAFISGHYQTKAPLPQNLLEKMLEAKNFQSAMFLIRQLEFALFDFTLHRDYVPERGVNAQAVLNAVRAQYAVLPVAPYARFQHSFCHIFAGGYAAGYYSYLWAEVLACDAFARFEEEGIFNAHTGAAFLTHILEKGGSEEAAVLFKKFRGREATMEAFLRQHGMKA